MSKINLLSSKVYNRIAAGEVIERPYAVVKELVENSIDAGAKSITVEIFDGGLTKIRVADDGTGIEKSELSKSILPHATSKISKAEDLESILTLGFRGEALASIASVSKMTIISKPSGQSNGAKLYCEGGDVSEIIDCASPNGTEIVVNNLFFNTPAREKFLKTKKGEEGDISSTVCRFILANPYISFKYVVDGKIVYQSFGDGLESAMVCVYGAKIINDCFKVKTEKNGIIIEGYIGKHYFVKSNRTYQTFFLNGRYVVNQTLFASLTNAYSSYLMKRQYPFCVLSISIPPTEVDVNVNPNKSDVRFSNNQIIYSAIYSTVSKVLDGSNEALNIVVENKQNSQLNSNENGNNYITHNNAESLKFGKLTFNSNNNFYNDRIENESDKKNETSVDIFAENKAFLEKLEREKNVLSSSDNPRNSVEQTSIKIEKELNYIGQALNTFLIFDDNTDLYFIDQHAAHERILYDKFINQVKNNDIETQSMLIPYVLNVNNLEFEFLIKKSELLKSMGIEIDVFGDNCFKISSVPVCLSTINLKSFFDELLSDLNVLKSISLVDLLKEKIAQKACKSAIKAGDSLTNDDIKLIMEQIKGDLGLKCPHGRPIAIKISRTEIDKWFKRIV